jgi:hypothetical protein
MGLMGPMICAMEGAASRSYTAFHFYGSSMCAGRSLPGNACMSAISHLLQRVLCRLEELVDDRPNVRLGVEQEHIEPESRRARADRYCTRRCCTLHITRSCLHPPFRHQTRQQRVTVTRPAMPCHAMPCHAMPGCIPFDANVVLTALGCALAGGGLTGACLRRPINVLR